MEENAKIKRFLDDRVMERSVYNSIRDSFLKKREGSDTAMLASSMLAIYLLEDAWRDLYKHKPEQQSKKKEIDQIGL
jgi:hypothetical protein